jgi:predicted regulator of Ras-like GTPase activity (Roadblock/LC7/MglB family)
VAPAYLSASKKPKSERKSMEMDESIPALFSDGRAPEPKPEPQAAPEDSAAPADTADTADHAPADIAPEETAPVETAEAEAHPAAPVIPEPQALAIAAAPADSHRASETVGEVFGQPHKKDWTPSEMVAAVVKLPGVAGAIVALQEGLQVASSLPEGVKSEVVAAFLPQIFARLNQYSGEMKLGDVDDLLFTTHGAHCQIYRLGFVYLAVLGKPGESLPWHELRLISEELARQTHK